MRELVALKLPRVLALAMRMLDDAAEAEDVAQETLLRTWRQAARWRGGTRLDTWLHRVALNLCYDRLRRRRERPVAEPPDQVDPALGADRQVERDQTARQVRAALAALPERQRAAVLLHHYQELRQAEAAAVLGVSVDAYESLLARARRTLRTRLEGAWP